MTFRTRKNEFAYRQHRRHYPNKGHCPFCAFSTKDNHIVRKTKLFWIVRNIFPYSVWENLPVEEHLMIVPKRHIDSLHHFNAAEKKEYVELLAEYDQKGYTHYMRAGNNVSKSVAHQHTHLLKLGTRHSKIAFYLKRPYVLWHM